MCHKISQSQIASQESSYWQNLISSRSLYKTQYETLVKVCGTPKQFKAENIKTEETNQNVTVFLLKCFENYVNFY